MTVATRLARHSGIPLLRYGFRPFFLSAGVWALLAMSIRIADVSGEMGHSFAFGDSTLWHIHAFLFGYGSAVVAGFALTAVPNWTGRLPISGTPLLVLWSLWLAGRLAFVTPLPPPVTAAIDAAFLPVLAIVVGREIVAGNNVRNIPVCGLILLLGVANLTFHLEVLGVVPSGGYGMRMGVGMLSLLIGLMGGRIVPSFTNNWFARRKLARKAVTLPMLERSAHALSAAAVLAWVALPVEAATGALLLLAGAAQTWRWLLWCGWRSADDPLVLVLHVAYAWIPLGFVLLGLATVSDGGMASAGIHALTAGAIGTMTLAVMTRATLATPDARCRRAVAPSRSMPR